MAARVVAAVVGLALVALAFPATGYLGNYSWSLGTPGFWLLVALPGSLLLAWAAGRPAPARLLPLLPFAFVLLGLDVTDSAAEGVPTAGYWVAGLSAVATVLSAVVLWRRRDTFRTSPG